jgi:hypothetical protein
LLGSDLHVGAAVDGEPGDVRLLGVSVLAAVVAPVAKPQAPGKLIASTSCGPCGRQTWSTARPSARRSAVLAGGASVTIRSTAESGQRCPNVIAPSLVWSAARMVRGRCGAGR